MFPTHPLSEQLVAKPFYFFTRVLWPNLSVEQLDRALAWDGQRDRRFGGSASSSPLKLPVV